MKRHLRRILGAAVVATMMLSSVNTSVFADDVYTITVNDATEGHEYTAYQIFTGTPSGGDVLTGVNWGAGISAEGQAALMTKYNAASAAEVAEALAGADAAAAKDFAATVRKYVTGGEALAFASGAYSADDFEGGYYLIDESEAAIAGHNLAESAFLLKVAGNVTLAPKTDLPTVQKKVQDVNDSEASVTANTDWNDSADYDEGDLVPFQIKATLPSNYADYSKYTLKFTDTMSAGLTFRPDSVTLRVADTEVDLATAVGFEVSNGDSIVMTINDLKKLVPTAGAGDEVVIEYSAELNDTAVIGRDGNPNTVVLEYSNNPNYDVNNDSDVTDDNNDGKDDDNNNDGQDDKGEKDSTGSTEEDTVIVFTYQVKINKVDANGQPLSGAKFQLFKYTGTATTEEAIAADTASWSDLGEIEGSGAESNEFSWDRVDDGIYKLVETQTPSAAYNKAEDVIFRVSATHSEEDNAPSGATLTSLSGTSLDNTLTFTKSEEDGTVETNIENRLGSALPETGGMGTKVLYTVGGAMVLIAGVMLVTKKRMSSEK